MRLQWPQSKKAEEWRNLKEYMRAKQHILIGGIASLVLSPIIGLGAIPFWIGSVLIDTDHYLEFIYHNRLTNFSIRRMYDYHYLLSNWWSRPEFLNLSIFHTVEFLLLFYLGALWLDSPMLKAALWGMLFHLFLDIIHLLRLGVVNKRAYSVIEFFIRKEIMKRNGLHPFTVCNKAVEAVFQDNPRKTSSQDNRS